MEIPGSHVVVTGAGTGIGRAIALAFVREGAKVSGLSRRSSLLEETARLASSMKGSFLWESVDVTDEPALSATLGRIVEKQGPVDLWFNNAGSFHSIAPVHEADPELWWRDVTINLFGPFLCCRLVLPSMLTRNRGIIINMGGGRPTGGSAYASSKAGLDQFTTLMAQELRRLKSDVIVLGAGPGLVRTEMTELQVTSEKGRFWMPGTQECFEAGKLCQPEDIALKTIEIVRGVTPAQSGAAFHPGTDVADFLKV